MSGSSQPSDRRSPVQACLLGLMLLTTMTVAACSHAAAPDPGQASSGHTPAAHLTMSAAPQTMAAPDAADVTAAAWAARPAFTRTSAETEAAYRYALDQPDLLSWIPCYCGCGAMGHGSNLDCYFEPHAGGSVVFEEHASYCRICVDITLRTKQLAQAGQTLGNIRAAIDAEFGGVGPGTDTALPS